MVLLAPLTQHLYLHSLLEERERLCKVAHAELVLRVFFHVLDLKVEPLLVAFGVGVDLAVKVVSLDNLLLLRPHLFNIRCRDGLHLCPVQVPTL